MKKITIFILAIILTMSLFVNISAQEINGNIYNYGNISVIFDSDSTLSVEHQQHIADTIINGDDGASTYNLACTLFGHKFDQTEYVTTITHEVNPTAPRCLQEYFIVHLCSRCQEDGQIESLGGEYIFCCPE